MPSVSRSQRCSSVLEINRGWSWPGPIKRYRTTLGSGTAPAPGTRHAAVSAARRVPGRPGRHGAAVLCRNGDRLIWESPAACRWAPVGHQAERLRAVHTASRRTSLRLAGSPQAPVSPGSFPGGVPAASRRVSARPDHPDVVSATGRVAVGASDRAVQPGTGAASGRG